MEHIRGHDKTAEIDHEETTVSIAESGKVIIDFAHIDGEEHTVAVPREAALALASFIQRECEKRG